MFLSLFETAEVQIVNRTDATAAGRNLDGFWLAKCGGCSARRRPQMPGGVRRGGFRRVAEENAEKEGKNPADAVTKECEFRLVAS
jgi:hypothetical protein